MKGTKSVDPATRSSVGPYANRGISQWHYNVVKLAENTSGNASF